MHSLQGVNAKNGLIMQPAVPEECFDFALNYVGISRPPDISNLFPIGRRFTPAMFHARQDQREHVRNEYARLRSIPGQPQNGLPLPSLEPMTMAPDMVATVD